MAGAAARPTVVQRLKRHAMEATSVIAVAELSAFGLTELLLRPQGVARCLKAHASDHGTSLQIVVSYVAAVILLALVAPATSWPRLAIGARAAAASLALAGLGLRWWSMVVLGRFYTRTLVTTTNQAVVRSGPYRIVRHPGYLGSLMTWTGAALALAPPAIAGLIGVILLLAYLRRVHHEERMLDDRFGSAYAAYRLETWRLIPFVY
jgi:protein-S-isoprenylcysteine O-methyltransferase Ste14